ncbi:actin-binding Rho-activating protein [Austrofundulus limnaeus]|uniref:Actin-binding Rho-activating protein-like n=1 Tax=Austrofundulus limnaeus TaxID=52670 RepID=A0A2I4ATM2_AUSLI|nr:PREDICTED: actin-binding Rho-activating protein-like [Austrofundulus limnaeus]XP_013858818.1 PREDICTED: actin-binding Rho-activating protein-like [Austrofundulus limnaeus]
MGTNRESTLETENKVTPAQQEGNTESHIVSVKGLKENWQKWSSEHRLYQKHNPFSRDNRLSVVVSQRGHDNYGRPPQGSLTEQRGMEAHTHVSKEIEMLCEAIRSIGALKEKDGDEGGGNRKAMAVEFGKLFEHYVTISNKLVGILLRARKQRLVEFEGEMLWQGKDDHVVISLVE